MVQALSVPEAADAAPCSALNGFWVWGTSISHTQDSKYLCRTSAATCFVCVTGIVKSAPFLEMSEEDFDAVIEVNLKGVFLCCQAAAQQMVRQGVLQTPKCCSIFSVCTGYAQQSVAQHSFLLYSAATS